MRENTILLHGQVHIEPRIYKKDGEYLRAIFAIKVLQRPYYYGRGEGIGNLFVDTPIVLSGNLELIKQIEQLHLGDMVDVKGVLTTREVSKSTICIQCSETNKVLGNSVFVTPIYICPRERQVDPVDAFELLKQRSEVSNVALLIGSLCRNPSNYYDSEKGFTITQYQLAVNRKFHIRDSCDVSRTDYPWIKSFARQAEQDMLRLMMGSTIYVNGRIQTRQVLRTCNCEHCGNQYQWKDTATEIVPYSVEYLSDCIFPEREKAGEERK